MSYLQRKARQARIAARGRVTAQPAAEFERTLTCTRCGERERVFEASNAGPHQWIDPAKFKCWTCVSAPAADVKPWLSVITGTPLEGDETS